MQVEMKIYKNYINGEWRGNKNRFIEVYNPSTIEKIGYVHSADEEEIDEAVQAADSAFKKWAQTSVKEKSEYLFNASKIVVERADKIAELMTLEQGKPFLEAKGEVLKGAEILAFYSEEAKRVHGEMIPGYDSETTSVTAYEPIGVTLAISPWNYPVELVAWKLGAALASGCTMIVKPPSETPLSPAAFIECIIDAGIPKGVLNIIFGKGSEAGPILINKEKIKKVAFTGSTEAGKSVAALCGVKMKKVSLELGGQCPFIVTENADIEKAAEAATRRSFRNNGQICIAVNRIYVHEKVYEKFLKKFVEKTKQLTIDDGIMNPGANLGPMASEKGMKKTMSHVADAIKKGAKLEYGGKKPEGKKYEKGYFYMPTIISNTDHKMLIMKEETFGPAVGVMKYSNNKEVIELANDTNYGLAAYVYTNDLHEADLLSREIIAGNIAINNPDAGVINAPYGGMKESGIGYEHGKAGLMEYMKIKHIRTKYFFR